MNIAARLGMSTREPYVSLKWFPHRARKPRWREREWRARATNGPKRGLTDRNVYDTSRKSTIDIESILRSNLGVDDSYSRAGNRQKKKGKLIEKRPRCEKSFDYCDSGLAGCRLVMQRFSKRLRDSEAFMYDEDFMKRMLAAKFHSWWKLSERARWESNFISA